MSSIDRWRRMAPVLGLALLAGGWAAGPAGAQEDDAAPTGRLVLRAVDASDPTDVRAVASWSGDTDEFDDVVVQENGEAVEVTAGDLADIDYGTDIAFVFDTSGSTDPNSLLAVAREAVDELLDDLPEGARASIISSGGGSQTLTPLTSDAAAIDRGLRALTPGGESALLSGVVLAAGSMSRSDTIPTVVLLTDGVEDSNTTLETARAALTAEGASLFVVGLQDGGLDESAFGAVAAQTGGRLLVAAEAATVADLVAEITPEVLAPRTFRFESAETVGVQDLDVTVGGATISGSYISGTTLIGARRLVPRPNVEGGGIEFFQTGIGRILGLAAAALAVAMFAYAMIVLFVREDTALNLAMRPYADGYVAENDDDDGSSPALAQTAFLQRAVAITEQFAERQGYLGKLELRLEQADLPLRAAEALFFYVAGVFLAIVGLLALTQNLLATIIVGGVIALAPPAILSFLTARKRKAFEAILPDTLQLLSSTLRAGYSMMQGVEAVSQEVAEPMGKELRRVVTEARLGRPLEESLEGVAERMESGDFAWAVMAIRIQREVGGNLAELLMTVSETMVQRERLRRDVNALTAEGRISAYVLIALPLGLGAFLWSANPDYIGKLFEVTLGQVMLGAAIVMMVVGYVWMMKIIKIEI